MKTYIAHLKPKGGFLNSVPQSDTLFGAICWGYRTLFEEDFDVFIASFRGTSPSPKLLISSSFPYFMSASEIEVERSDMLPHDGRVYLLPKPKRSPVRQFPECLEDAEKAKRYKAVQCVTEGLFKQMISPDFDEAVFYETVRCPADAPKTEDFSKNVTAIQIGEAIYEKEIIERVYDNCEPDEVPKRMAIFQPIVRGTVMRNTTDRIAGGVSPESIFGSDFATLRGGLGLYFLLRCDDTEKLKLEAVLRYLAEGGLGGDLGVGKGWYTFDGGLNEATGIFARDSATHGFVTLSLFYCPADQLQRFDLGRIWYDLITRKGKVDALHIQPHNPWKKTTLMFAEGSTFMHPEGGTPQSFYGANPIVSTKENNHYFDVQLFGHAFPIGL